MFSFLILPENIKLTNIDKENVIAKLIRIFPTVNLIDSK